MSGRIKCTFHLRRHVDSQQTHDKMFNICNYCECVCVCTLTQLSLTLCNPMDCSLLGYSLHGIFQARILEWVDIFLLQGIFLTQGSNLHLLHWQEGSLPLHHLGRLFSSVQLLSRVQLFVTP